MKEVLRGGRNIRKLGGTKKKDRKEQMLKGAITFHRHKREELQSKHSTGRNKSPDSDERPKTRKKTESRELQNKSSIKKKNVEREGSWKIL